MRLVCLDHVVLTVHDVDRASRFYQDVLGMDEVIFGGGRRGLHFGQQKINLQPVDVEHEPLAQLQVPGTADLCFIVENLDAAIARLGAAAVAIVEGPVYRTGASSPLLSVYIRDPDGNLIELSQPQDVVIASDDRAEVRLKEKPAPKSNR
ncbi:VOC family protein [Pseudovibrio sp. Tun.PSC04-5.I4]|uniref:VOC family protein n=1 Tax=Pseudovibrio sp. Tun.PSC04-5.I4 TaxID=1798213 RepID=UPI000887CDF3|nr:VOC family protein [Pseudovibrio sp. Tun.PSC04-5.I4]SDR08960.1 Catechol 2,3-dioxygenase [Pseudovibrio sp. Tun.PSC04-5.I4]